MDWVKEIAGNPLLLQSFLSDMDQALDGLHTRLETARGDDILDLQGRCKAIRTLRGCVEAEQFEIDQINNYLEDEDGTRGDR